MGLTGRIKEMFLRSGHQTEEVADDAHYVLSLLSTKNGRG